MKILVSACLLGIPCRYNETDALCTEVVALGEAHTLIPACPEQLGGLPTPRQPAEIVGDKVLAQDGTDVTDAFARGAELACQLARTLGCTHAILKQKSPSCGCGKVYDGRFDGTIIAGDGLTARALKACGVSVYSEDERSPFAVM